MTKYYFYKEFDLQEIYIKFDLICFSQKLISRKRVPYLEILKSQVVEIILS